MPAQTQPPLFLLALLPVFFVGLWFAITSLLGLVSGWYGLMPRYPDRDEAETVTLRGVSAQMGAGVNMNGVLTLGACPSGLRVRIAQALAPFCKPLFVPWDDIRATRRKILFGEAVRLEFGGGNGLTIQKRTWDKLAPAAPNVVAPD